MVLDGCPRFAPPAPPVPARRGACRGAYLGRKRWGDPDFLYAALETTACAAFFKESRMKCAGATKLRRKIRGKPFECFCYLGRETLVDASIPM
jgi:hypothetical protein